MFGKIGNKEYELLKDGKPAVLSVRRITKKLIDLDKAKANLSEEDYKNVKALYTRFTEVETCREKREMLLAEYNSTADLIISAFDQIAPYDLYSGDLWDIDRAREKTRLKNIYDAEMTERRLNLLDRVLFWMNESGIEYDRLRFYAASIPYFDCVCHWIGVDKNWPKSYFSDLGDLHDRMDWAVDKLLEREYPQEFDVLKKECAEEMKKIDAEVQETSDTAEEYIEDMTARLFEVCHTDPSADITKMKDMLIQEFMTLIE